GPIGLAAAKLRRIYCSPVARPINARVALWSTPIFSRSQQMNFEVPALPYDKTALEPAMSSRTLEFHYEKHHKGYMTKLKAALEGKPEASKSLEDVVRSSEGGVFNNAAQVYNHTFFWESMKPSGGGAPPSG